MPTTRCINVYQFEELSDSAKEEARAWYRQYVFSDSCDWGLVFEDAERMAKILGIEIDRRNYNTVGGGAGSEPAIYFSGFYSQGDGACFEGSYRYAKGAVEAIKKETGCGIEDAQGVVHEGDRELIRIAEQLQDVQRRNFYRLRATMKHRGHYYHSGEMRVEVEDSDNPYRDIGDAEEDVTQLMRDFADWIYSQLKQEYEYQMSNEAVDEAIICNEYEFDEEGGRV